MSQNEVQIDDLDYDYIRNAKCVECWQFNYPLNRFGYCAKCFADVDAESIARMMGRPIQIVTKEVIRDVVETKVTNYVHNPSGKRVFLFSVITSTVIAFFGPAIVQFVRTLL